MSITNKEKREVAARLREHAKTARRVGYACVLKNCTSEEECDGFGIEGCEGCFSKSLKRLADLIESEPERTCRMYRDETGIWHCEACEDGADQITGSSGELDNWCDSWVPNYCPNCGAKVLED